jgi:hypothetical protein
MPEKQYSLESLLRESFEREQRQAPTMHSQMTAECPQPARFAEFARTGWPEEFRAHVPSCPFCQKCLAAAFSVECPGWRILQDYSSNPGYVSRLAVERHIGRDGCGACATRLALLRPGTSLVARVRNWLTIPWDFGSPTLAAAADGVRPQVRLFEPFDDPPVVVHIEEGDAGLSFWITTREATLARKAIEIRLEGERFEVRASVTLAGGPPEWRGNATIPASEEQLRDICQGRRYLSIGVAG